MKWFALALFMLSDTGAFISVPKPVLAENEWALIPGCGFVLAAEYNFGNKLKTPNSPEPHGEPHQCLPLPKETRQNNGA